MEGAGWDGRYRVGERAVVCWDVLLGSSTFRDDGTALDLVFFPLDGARTTSCFEVFDSTIDGGLQRQNAFRQMRSVVTKKPEVDIARTVGIAERRPLRRPLTSVDRFVNEDASLRSSDANKQQGTISEPEHCRYRDVATLRSKCGKLLSECGARVDDDGILAVAP